MDVGPRGERIFPRNTVVTLVYEITKLEGPCAYVRNKLSFRTTLSRFRRVRRKRLIEIDKGTLQRVDQEDR